MKYLQRFCCLLCAFVLLLGVFSPIVNAEEATEEVASNFKFTWKAYDSNNLIIASSTYNTGEGLFDFFASDYVHVSIDQNYSIFQNLDISSNDTSFIVKKGQNFKFDLSKVNNYIYWESLSDFTFMKAFDSVQIVLNYADSTSENITSFINWDFEFIETSSTFSVYTSEYWSAPKDVVSIWIQFKYSPMLRIGKSGWENYLLGYGHDGSNFNIEVQSEEAGFLDSILGWVKDIWDIVSSGFANVVKGITELPQKLWDLISEGLKGLFVPDDEYMAGYSDKWDTLLADRFGAIYQVCDIVANSWDGIMAAETDTVLDFPEVTIPIGNGESFTFGGYKVRVMPAQFRSTIRPYVVTITSIICTIAFINGLLKRYEEIFGGKE